MDILAAARLARWRSVVCWVLFLRRRRRASGELVGALRVVRGYVAGEKCAGGGANSPLIRAASKWARDVRVLLHSAWTYACALSTIPLDAGIARNGRTYKSCTSL